MVALAHTSPAWNPVKIRRVEETLKTGTQAVAVVTDVGRCVAKFLGNTEGPHVLAAEFIGTRLAALLGLPVFDHAVFDYDGFPEIVLTSGAKAKAGPAWITRREEGVPWSGGEEHLALLANPADVAGLVVLDCWTRNCDRHCPARQPTRINRNNVFFSRESAPEGQFRLIAMDHTHILTCGRELTPALAEIDVVKDDTVYGLFPEFAATMQLRDFRAACARLAAVPSRAIEAVVAAVPVEWEVDAATRSAIVGLLTGRRDYLATDLPTRIFPQAELF